MNVAYLTNIIPPYRVRLFELLAADEKNHFSFIFCARSEGNRNWSIGETKFPAIFLSEGLEKSNDGFNYRHLNWNVLPTLHGLRPDTVVLTGLYPTMLLAFIYSVLTRKSLVYMTDGHLDSEQGLSSWHRLLRRVVFRFCRGFIGASAKSKALFLEYGIGVEKIFWSPLCVDNVRYINQCEFFERDIDVLFCGQLHERKLPYLFLDIVRELQKTRKIRAVMVGSGPLSGELQTAIEEECLPVEFLGNQDSSQLVDIYRRTKVLAFTTRLDAWGLVANEALASGVPVVISRVAGAADELVRDGENGFVVDNLLGEWTQRISGLLDSPELWSRLSHNARASVEAYNYAASVHGILQGVSKK